MGSWVRQCRSQSQTSCYEQLSLGMLSENRCLFDPSDITRARSGLVVVYETLSQLEIIQHR